MTAMLRCMRTTLTLDADVAATVQRMQRTRECTLKAIINEGLRRGLQEMEGPRERAAVYRTPSVDLGRCLVGSLDDVAEALALVEDEAFR